MEIKTKFSIGHKVWAILNCKATELEISEIIVKADGVFIVDREHCDIFNENHCFASRDELIDYILRS